MNHPFHITLLCYGPTKLYYIVLKNFSFMHVDLIWIQNLINSSNVLVRAHNFFPEYIKFPYIAGKVI